MKLIKKNGASEVRVVISETDTHYIGAELNTAFITGMDAFSVLAFPKANYTVSGNYNITAIPEAENT